VKIIGPRSLQSKMWRIADELRDDARRLRDGGDENRLAASVEQISLDCRHLAEQIGELK
jgi:hypothetical protein